MRISEIGRYRGLSIVWSEQEVSSFSSFTEFLFCLLSLICLLQIQYKSFSEGVSGKYAQIFEHLLGNVRFLVSNISSLCSCYFAFRINSSFTYPVKLNLSCCLPQNCKTFETVSLGVPELANSWLNCNFSWTFRSFTLQIGVLAPIASLTRKQAPLHRTSPSRFILVYFFSTYRKPHRFSFNPNEVINFRLSS